MLTRTILTVVIVLLGQASVNAADQHVDPELKYYLKKAASESYSFKDRFDATVWLTDMSTRLRRRVPDPKMRIKILKLVHHEARRVRIEPELVLAIIEVESNFNSFAVSRVGAVGLMQVMPFWVKEIGKPKDNLFRISTNLRYGCTILRFYLDKEKGNRTKALARYNGSVGKWKYPSKVYKALRKRWFRQ
jgi:soluble lytic murein transglycosylase-like protein